MDRWIEKEKCTGCGACSNVCPVNAIKMLPDTKGFEYPFIEDNCINCGNCKNVCNNRKDNCVVDYDYYGKDVYAAWSNDSINRFNSTSGGVFGELANFIIDIGGIVVGAGYNNNQDVVHMIVKERSNIDILRQSKYVQSSIGFVYRDIKNYLLKGKKVLFVGTPCQVAGLKSYLGNNILSNLFTIDFICLGVNSPYEYRIWIKDLEHQENSKIDRIWFKYKIDGWKKSPLVTKVVFKNQNELVLRNENNKYMTKYLQNRSGVRICCTNCDFKGDKRASDITLGDFWGVDYKYDDDNGTSVIIVNSYKGKQILDKIKCNLKIFKTNLEKVKMGNELYENSVKYCK